MSITISNNISIVIVRVECGKNLKETINILRRCVWECGKNATYREYLTAQRSSSRSKYLHLKTDRTTHGFRYISARASSDRNIARRDVSIDSFISRGICRNAVDEAYGWGRTTETSPDHYARNWVSGRDIFLSYAFEKRPFGFFVFV